MLESFEPGQGVKFEVLVDVWPQPRLTGPYTGLTVEAEEEAFEEELVVKALQEMRKREALAVLSGAETRAAIHPELSGTAEFRAEGAVAVVDLDGYRRNPDGTKGDKVPPTHPTTRRRSPARRTRSIRGRATPSRSR
jgi:hypothetical protein